VSKPHVVVVGAGISGLTAAYRLRRLLGEQVRLTIVEQSATAGGKLRTVELAGQRFDVGAEAFLTRRPEALDLVCELGLQEELVYCGTAGARLRFDGRTALLPPRTLLGVPTSTDGLGEVLSADGLAKVRAEPDTPMNWTGEDVAVGPLVTRRLGPEVTQRLVEPLLGGVYGAPAERLGLRATMPALAAALDRDAATTAQPSLVAAARAVLADSPPSAVPPFATLRRGLSVLVGALLTASEAQLCCGLPVRALVPTAGGWRLQTGAAPPSATRHLDADAVLLAVPPPALRRLLTPLHTAAGAAAAGIEIASSVIVSLALPAAAAGALHGSSGVLTATGEPLHSRAFTYSSVKWPHLGDVGVTLLRASLDVTNAATARADDAELIRAVRADLAELTGVDARPVDAMVTRWGGGLPQYDVGHDARVEAIESGVAQLPRLAVAGAALHGIGVPACIATADAAARRLAATLPATA